MIARCPISYQPTEGDLWYSESGLRSIDPRLKALAPLELTAQELVHEASRRAARMSIQGVQPKLSLILDVVQGVFEIVDEGGRFILKPPNPLFPSLPENEDLTMKLAATAGIEVPDHGMVYGKDHSLSYVIRRFDRSDKAPHRLPVEDFAQLSGRSRETKYDSSIERVVAAVNAHCTFPRVELSTLFRRILFSFLVGNEDMHLKNYSVIVRGHVARLSPAYDLLNTTMVLGPDAAESALPIGGKHRGLTRRLLLDYLGAQRCGLPAKEIDAVLSELHEMTQQANDVIGISFLSDEQKTQYAALVAERAQRLFG